MENTRSATLTTLLAVKMRRERSIRSAIAVLTSRGAVLSEQKNRLVEERRITWEQWRLCGAGEQVLDHTALQDLKIELAGYCQRDAVIVDRIDAVQGEWNQLQLEEAEQQSLLRKVLIEQEKLKILLE